MLTYLEKYAPELVGQYKVKSPAQKNCLRKCSSEAKTCPRKDSDEIGDKEFDSVDDMIRYFEEWVPLIWPLIF